MITFMGIPGGSGVKHPFANAGDTGDKSLIPEWGRSPGVGNGKPLQYSCLATSMDRGAWWATVHGVAKSWTRPSTLACMHDHFNHHHPIRELLPPAFHAPVTGLPTLYPSSLDPLPAPEMAEWLQSLAVSRRLCDLGPTLVGTSPSFLDRARGSPEACSAH